ncbi:MAG: DUF2188 domain-containing protein [Candidatus Dojkabacteria bacterium]
MAGRSDRMHVTKVEEHKWQYKREGAERASGFTRTQAEAEKKSKQILSNDRGGQSIIHGEDGKIRDADTVSPAKDPNPPIDKKH